MNDIITSQITDLPSESESKSEFLQTISFWNFNAYFWKVDIK